MINGQRLIENLRRYRHETISIDGLEALISQMESAQPSVSKTEIVGDVISRQAALKALENINHVFMDLGMSCAYDMPSFWYHDRKEYKVIPTKYHKGYQKALEDVEEKIKPILEELCYG